LCAELKVRAHLSPLPLAGEGKPPQAARVRAWRARPAHRPSPWPAARACPSPASG